MGIRSWHRACLPSNKSTTSTSGIVFEYVSGSTLREMIDRQGLSVEDARARCG
jgi:hypothetical protein